MENNHAGGMDSFLTNLINKWPKSTDEIILIINNSHPGNKVLHKNIYKKIIFHEHDILISWSLTKKYLYPFPNAVRRIFHPFIKMFVVRPSFEISCSHGRRAFDYHVVQR